MKDGDRLYCIKTNFTNGNDVHIRNRFYTIMLIDKTITWVHCEPETMPHGYCGYMTDDKDELYNDFKYLSKYFADIKEMRKMKLKKLNERR
jgi:hypothetical protein